MTKKTWIIFAAVCVLLIGGLIYLQRSSKIDVSNVDARTIQKATKDNGSIADHTYGNMDSKVTLIEYGDYQCPGCGDAYPIIKKVTEKYKDQLGFIFRNYPLPSLHPNARAAATAAEAIGLQGKFWEAHNALYENQSSWNQLTGVDRTNYFKDLATRLGVDGAKVENTLNNKTAAADQIEKKIEYDQALGSKQGVTGTPTLYLNGVDVSNKYFKGGKLVEKTVTGAQPVWSDADAFDNLIVKPALVKNGMLK